MFLRPTLPARLRLAEPVPVLPVLVLSALLAGCSAALMPSRDDAQAAIRVTCPHVPPPEKAKPPLPPVSAFPQILQPGHWDWDDGQYVWTTPHWETAFNGSAQTWQPGHWESTGGACVWHHGVLLPAAAPTRARPKKT